MITRFLKCLPAIALLASLVNAYAQSPIGAGDVLRIAVFGNPDLSMEVKVSENGAISLPLLGEVTVAGLEPAAAEKKIADGLDKGGFVRKPQVNIVVTMLQSQQVSVLGQVNKPGRYPVDGKRTLTDLLAMAGGISTDGGEMITIIRTNAGHTTKQQFDLGSLVDTSKKSVDIELLGNDIVYVPRAPRFYIYGEVQRPGYYRLERNMTVLQTLSTGGGLTPRGTERGITIKRRSAEGKLEMLKVSQEDLVQDGDIVYVQESLF